MSKLQELYEAREKLRALGIEPNADLERQLSELEESIIRNEIVPIITDKVEPVLRQVQREVVLVVEHTPGDGVKVHLSRKRNITNAISDAITLSVANNAPSKIEPREHNTGITRSNCVGKNPASRLRVTFSDRTSISERLAIDTLKRFIQKVGVERVAQLCAIPVDPVLQPCKVNLVTRTRDKYYGNRQHEIEGGWLVFTCSNTPTKKRQIEAIAKVLGVSVKVDIV